MSPVQNSTFATSSSMDDHSRWKETEEVYSILLTRGEDPEWRTSLESLHFQNLYLEKGFSLSLQEINKIRKSIVVRVLNTLVKDGVNFLSCYTFTERVNQTVWRRIGHHICLVLILSHRLLVFQLLTIALATPVWYYGSRLPAHRGYPWRPRIHNDSDPRELLCSLWRVWRGLTVDHENQHSEPRLLDESTNQLTQRARLAIATAPVEEINGVRFIDEYKLSPETPYIFNIVSAVAPPFDMSKPDLDSVLINLQKPMPAAREDGVSVECCGPVGDFFNLFRCIFYLRTLQVGLDRASSEYHRLGAWKRFVRPALAERDYFITQNDIEEWSIKIDGFGNTESMMNSDFMAAFWACEEFRLCDSVLVQDLDTLLFRRDLEMEIQCNAPLLDWDASEGPLQIVINSRFNIPEESLRESKVLVSSARPAFLRVLAKVEGEQDIPSHLRLSTGLIDLSRGVLPTGGSQAMYHLVVVIPQGEDGQWDRIRRFDPGGDSFCLHASSTLGILIYAFFDAGSMPYLDQRRNPDVPEQKGSSDPFGQSAGPSVFAPPKIKIRNDKAGNFFIVTSTSRQTAPGGSSNPVEASAKRGGAHASEYPNKNQKGENGWRTAV
ncbi:unnamed protein product [Clonostachys solani]|uniref:Uncharacterized protein n=1 Tax=Clonostachys solani TaxID=160281 RepID=A0A9N9Z5B0_9HYPO|nr:unnamed protein product [Clonostachys solani]